MDARQLSASIMKAVRDFVQPAVDALAKRIDDGLLGLRGEFDKKLAAVTKRIDAIETKGVRYRGVYQRSDEYVLGDLATWDGSMWHCAVQKTQAHPGKSSDWQLAVKRGDNASAR